MQRDQTKRLGDRPKFGKTSPLEPVPPADEHRADQRVHDEEVLFLIHLDPTAVSVRLDAQPDAEGEQREDVLRARAEQPRQPGDASEPEQDGVRRSRGEMIHLPDERDVREEQDRTGEMHRLRKDRMVAGPGETPTGVMRADQRGEARGELHATRDVRPVRGKQEDDARADQHGADDAEDDHQLVDLTVEPEVFDDRGRLIGGDQPRVADAVDVDGLHVKISSSTTDGHG